MDLGNTWDIAKQVIDVIVVTYIIYAFLSFSKGTRSIQMFLFLMVMLGLFLVAQERFFDLPTFRWLLDKFWSVIIIILVILFQDEIRRSLSRFRLLDTIVQPRSHSTTGTMEEVVKAARSLSAKRIGGLIAIERSGSLDPYVSESGIRMDAFVSRELLFAIFLPEHGNPTHDGAVIVRKNRIVAAGWILPLSSQPGLEPWVGTRHRAALGLSEHVDALVVVVSEETGRISVALGGELNAGLSPDELRQALLNEVTETGSMTWMERLRKATVERVRTRRRES